MEVAETLKVLRQIQELDTGVADLTRQRDAVPAALRVVMREIATATTKLDAEVLAQKKLKVKIDELETTVKMAEDRIADLKGKQNSASTNKEYAAFDLDIANQQLAVDKAEEAELEAMGELEAANERVAAAQKELAKHEAARDAQKGVLDEKVNEFNRQIDELKGQREGLAPTVDEDIYEEYEDIKTYRDGLAMVPVTADRICQGCMTAVLPNKLQELAVGKEVVQCDQCRRYLFLADAEVED